MQISEAELRAMVREAIARHTQSSAERVPAPAVFHAHASHGRFELMRGSEGDGACVIEPSVRCNHCGYCQSYGH
jgi:hypothetical protein